MKLFKRTITLLISIIVISTLIIGFNSYIPANKQKVSDKEIERFLVMLEQENIKISKDCIPKKYPNLPDIVLKNSLCDREGFAKKILDDDYSVYDTSTYIDSDSTLIINGNLFSIYFNEDNYMENDLKNADYSELNKTFSKLVKNYGFLNTDIIISEKTATVMSTYKKIPVFNSNFRIHYSENGISEIEGIWFVPTGAKYQKKRRALISIFKEISDSPDIIGKTITDISIGYKIDEFSEFREEVIAYPVWRITVDDKVSYDYEM